MVGVNEAETRVVVRLRDVNDLPPIFLQNSYDAVIFEESIHRFRPIITVGWASFLLTRSLYLDQLFIPSDLLMRFFQYLVLSACF